MKLTFLSADKPLTKSYVLNTDGTWESTPYPLTSEFTSHTVDVNDIEDFYAQLVAHAEANHCLLKGNLQKQIVRESRAGLTASETTSWICLDFDGMDPKGRTVDDILIELGVGHVDYILQYSSSQGIKSGLNAHVFMLIDKATTPEHMKMWLKWRNLTVPLLREQLSLTKSAMSLHWPLDITVCQNDKLLYIAPPIISGAPDPVARRTILVQGAKRKATIGDVPPNMDNTAIEVVKQLRSAAGLPDHKLNVKYYVREKAEILPDPDKASITGVKRNGDFTYVNLNAGDSWGYYHNTAHPELLHNFKGEPVYRVREIAPEYYIEAKTYAKGLTRQAHRPEKPNGKTQRFVINRIDEGKYYKVTYNPATGITLDPAPTFKHIEDWCTAHKMPSPDIIEDWTITFNPTTTETINVAERTINMYRPTQYRINAARTAGTVGSGGRDIPAIYRKLIHHVCGSDDEATERLINWLAYVWQTGKKPKTAWVLHGTYGTGKGRFLKILSALFGDQCVITTPEAVSEHFNAAIERAQILWIDEVTTDSWDNEKITPKLRNWISEDQIALRGMRKDMRNINSYMGIFIAANEHNPVEVRFGDRRYNVAPRQEVKLLDTPWAIDEVLDDDYGWLYQPENLQELANALYLHTVDVSLVRRPLENAAKVAVMRVTQQLPEDIVQALQLGNAGFFLEYVQPSGILPTIEATEYKQIVEKIMRGGRIALSTKDIAKIFEFIAGWKQPPGKFTKACSKYGLHLSGKTAREGSRTFAGTYFTFNVTDQDQSLWAQYNDSGLKLVKEA